MLRKIYLILFILFQLIPTAQGFEYHLLKKGETVSGVIYEKFGGPIYGKKGLLKKVLKHNTLSFSKSKKLLPGTKIYFPTLKVATIKLISPIIPEVEKLEPIRGVASSPIEPTNFTPQQEATVKDEFKQTSNIKFDLVKQFGRYDYIDTTTGSSSGLISNFDTGANLSWSNTISESYSYQLNYSLLKLNLQDFTTTNKTITNKSLDINDVVANFGINSKLGIVSIGIGAEENIYTYSPIPTQITIEKAVIPKLIFTLSNSIFNYKKVNIANKLQLKYLGTGSAAHNEVQSGYGYNNELSFTREYNKFSIASSVFYQKEIQNSNTQKQNNTQLGFKLSVIYNFE